MTKIYQIYGEDAHEMTLKLLEARNAIELVPAGGSVALKPNLVIAGTPESGATTHAGVLSGAIEYFQTRGPDGTNVSLMDEVKQNKLTVIDFWASWCGGSFFRKCPSAIELYKQYQPQGLGIIGIPLDNRARAFRLNATEAMGITWPQMSDLKGWENEIALYFNVTSIPPHDCWRPPRKNPSSRLAWRNASAVYPVSCPETDRSIYVRLSHDCVSYC